TTTGRPAAAKALVTARSRPSVASSTIRVGWRVCTRSTSVATPLASLATAQRSPEGRRAMSTWALATSIPTKHGTSLLRTPVRPTWRIRAQGHQTTVRALGVQNVTTHATLRSRWTKAQSFSTFSQVLHGHECGDLLGHRRSDELVQRDAILLGQGADLLVERLREAQTDGAHGNTPMISSNVFGVTIAIPNCSAPRKL